MSVENINNKYSLLKTKDIIAILDGDTILGKLDIGHDTNIEISLPKLSGRTLCEISNDFGLRVKYGFNEPLLSRWQYMDNLLEYCIEKNRVGDLLKFLFSKEQFAEKLKGLTPNEIDSAYETIVTKMMEKINGELHFGGNELVILAGNFIVEEKNVDIKIKAPAIKTINREYIATLSERALNDISLGSYDSAITKSRTLLEEVFCFVIERKGDVPSTKSDIGVLYGQVKKLYDMHQVKGADVRINTLLSGFEKILSSITEMRNVNSDAHGVGEKRFKLDDYHARLYVNSATTMADFILSVSEKNLRAH